MRFMIRDLLWLMVVCAVAAYGYRERCAMELRVAKMEEEVAKREEKLKTEREQVDGKMKLADLKLKSAVESSQHVLEHTRFFLEISNPQRTTPGGSLGGSRPDIPTTLFVDP